MESYKIHLTLCFHHKTNTSNSFTKYHHKPHSVSRMFWGWGLDQEMKGVWSFMIWINHESKQSWFIWLRKFSECLIGIWLSKLDIVNKNYFSLNQQKFYKDLLVVKNNKLHYWVSTSKQCGSYLRKGRNGWGFARGECKPERKGICDLIISLF